MPPHDLVRLLAARNAQATSSGSAAATSSGSAAATSSGSAAVPRNAPSNDDSRNRLLAIYGNGGPKEKAKAKPRGKPKPKPSATPKPKPSPQKKGVKNTVLKRPAALKRPAKKVEPEPSAADAADDLAGDPTADDPVLDDPMSGEGDESESVESSYDPRNAPMLLNAGLEFQCFGWFGNKFMFGFGNTSFPWKLRSLKIWKKMKPYNDNSITFWFDMIWFTAFPHHNM